MTVCQNCETILEGKFCAQCGQKSTVKRITLRAVLNDLIKKLTMWDSGLLYTTLQLMKAPGHMPRRYLMGNRVNFTKPLNYILIVVAASIVFFPKKKFDEAMSGISADNPVKMTGYMDWIFSHISLIYLMLIPFLALVSKWFNRKADVNYAEHFVFYCYLMAGCTVVSVPFTILFNALDINPISSTSAAMVQYGVWFIFFAWGYVQFFKKQGSYWGGIQGVLVLLIAYVMYTVLIGLVLGLVIAFLKILGMDPVQIMAPNNVSPTQ